ncbi:unnamed protein product [Tilletia controversa]|uniref:Ribosomal eL28/Mak16 domain-containing protein n=1 Tax=Tilletia controversa TaxID=13291 RepID=A0A8X7T0G6_9BASI|nr:hypothetical protein CF328_g571 [Tilletia controversa]KAE8255008.1 hypothetical protein A4X06_0g628 [Tilletia controversa]CAD6896917.1 unnamed protein product [Tilletia controversa]CAD6908537.1 unnamed protein product [Tilletia controversa]CAD6945969.1 unnamed protein product [Tilletia controversa]
MVQVSNELEYLLTRTTSSYIVKQNGLPRYFSREPRNLAQIHAFKYSGTTNNKTIGIEAVPGGIVVSTRKSKAAPNTLKGAYSTTTIKKGGSRRAAGVASNAASKTGYRRDLTQVAVARATKILRAQNSRKVRPTAIRPRGKKAIAAANAKLNKASAEESAAVEETA